MLENQDIEFKTIWKDEFLKWICGMANANGGIIYIGKDDKGIKSQIASTAPLQITAPLLSLGAARIGYACHPPLWRSPARQYRSHPQRELRPAACHRPVASSC